MDRYPDQELVRIGKFMGCLRKAGMPDGFYSRVIDEPHFRRWLARVAVEPSPATTQSQDRARKIMGKNMLGLFEVAKYFLHLTEEQEAALAEVPFSKKTLHTCSSTHVLVADLGLSISDVNEKSNQGVFQRDKTTWDWRNDEKVREENDDVACWRLIRKTPIEKCTNLSWKDQQAYVLMTAEIPSARQFVYMVVLYRLATGERLYKHIYLRTSSFSSRDNRILVGDIGVDGVQVGDFSKDENWHNNISLTTAEKP